MRVALARTLNGREGVNSMNLTTSCPFSKFKLMARCILDCSSGSTGRGVSGQQVIRTTSVLHPRRSSRCIGWAIHNRRPFLESLHTRRCHNTGQLSVSTVHSVPSKVVHPHELVPMRSKECGPESEERVHPKAKQENEKDLSISTL